MRGQRALQCGLLHSVSLIRCRFLAPSSNSSATQPHLFIPVRHKFHKRSRERHAKSGVKTCHQLYEFRVRMDDDSDHEDEFLNYLQKNVTKFYLDSWKRRLDMFRACSKEELLSTAEKDVKCFHALSYMARGCGLYCQMYWKTVVISKVPLPIYRPDLDPDRPQRQVHITPHVFMKGAAYLAEYNRHKNETPAEADESQVPVKKESFPAQAAQDPYDPLGLIFGDARRSKLMFDRQRAWQESREGQMMLEFRSRLPSCQFRLTFLEALAQSQVLVITGGTGCGKTTQIPQYILESEIDSGCGSSCNIICTQPRRISASSVAERVSEERGEVLGETVGFQVRFEVVRSRTTNLLFCTTGILLRRLMSDPVLKGVTYLIVDEIHERGLNEDFLLIVLKDVIQRRPDLKLILMSATVDAKLFESYFPGSRSLHIPGISYPVTSYYLEDVLNFTNYKLNVHSRMWKYLRKAPEASDLRAHISEDHIVKEAINAEDYSNAGRESIDFHLIERLLAYILRECDEGAVLVFMTGWDDISSLRRQLKQHPWLGDPNRVLLLACHGAMSPEDQRKIFDRPPGLRKIILATNIAETSITVEDVVYVVDIGKAKEKSYDVTTNTACLLPSWISKASVRQRKGRAGRLKPGVCFHLYPESVFNAFNDHDEPEILRTALHNVCLRIKGLQLGDIKTFLGKAIQPPDPNAMHIAIEFLKVVGALDNHEELTTLGKHLAMLPVEPQIGKMLIMGCIFQCLDPILTIAAALSSRDPFVVPVDKREDSNQAKYNFSVGDMSDHLAIVRAFNDWDVCMKHNTASEFCRTNFLSMQALIGMTAMRNQFLNLLKDTGFLEGGLLSCESYSSDPMIVRAVICAGLFPGVAAVVANPGSVTHKTMDGAVVHVHPNSVNARHEESSFPWLMFLEKVRTSSVFIRDSTGVSDSILLLFGGPLISLGQPGHLQMCGKCLEFFMNNSVADLFLRMRGALDELLRLKLAKPELDIYTYKHGLLMRAVLSMINGDILSGSFIYGEKTDVGNYDGIIGRKDAKLALRAALLREGLTRRPLVSTRLNKAEMHVSTIQFRGLRFIGVPAKYKVAAERNACAAALAWLKDPENAEKKRYLMWGGGKLTKLRLGDCLGGLKKIGQLTAADKKRYDNMEVDLKEQKVQARIREMKKAQKTELRRKELHREFEDEL